MKGEDGEEEEAGLGILCVRLRLKGMEGDKHCGGLLVLEVYEEEAK